MKKKEKRGLVVLFPGIRYSAECPLLYFAGIKYRELGYEKVEISGYGVTDHNGSHKEYAEKAKQAVEEQLGHIDFSAYDEVVFVSKSIGTVLALWAEDFLHVPQVTHVLLTPINQTLPLLTQERKIRFMVSGTDDKLIDLHQLKKICQENHLPLHTVKHVGHRLEKKEDVCGSIQLLEKLVKQM